MENRGELAEILGDTSVFYKDACQNNLCYLTENPKKLLKRMAM